jgi:hypothetical protein
MPAQNAQYLTTLLFLGGDCLLSKQHLPRGAIQETAEATVDYWEGHGGGAFLRNFKTEATVQEAVKYLVIALYGVQKEFLANLLWPKT